MSDPATEQQLESAISEMNSLKGKFAEQQTEIASLKSQVNHEQERSKRFEDSFKKHQSKFEESERRNRELKKLLNEKGIAFEPSLVTGGSDAV